MATLFDEQRKDQKKELWFFTQECGIHFDPELDIALQVTELLKTTIYYFKLFTKDEIITIFPQILKVLGFPEPTWPSEQWIRMQMNYIKKMKGVSRYYLQK